MPNDDTKEFTAAQSRHAQESKIVRTFSRATGVPMNQIRQALRQSTTEGPQDRRVSGPVPLYQTSPEIFGPSNIPRKLEPKPFGQRGVSGTIAGGSTEAGSAGTVTLIVDVSGTLMYYNFTANYDSNV